MERLPKKVTFAYGLGGFGYFSLGQTISSFLMFFGTAIAKIPGSIVGFAIAIASVWDAFTDPLVGYISDKYKQKNKSRQSFLLPASLFMMVFNVLLWLVPNFESPYLSALYITAMLICFETCETAFGTPYAALGYELSLDKNENTSLQNSKSVFSILGTIMPPALLVIFTKGADFSLAGADKLSFVKIGLASGICGIVCALVMRACIKENKAIGMSSAASPKKRDIIFSFFKIFKNKSCLCVILGYCASMIATSLLTSIGLHVFTYSLHYNSLQIALLLGLLLLGAILSQTLVYFAAKRRGKLQALIKFLLVIVLAVSSMLILFFIRSLLSKTLTFLLFALLMLICGVGSGALYSLPTSIFCDIIQSYNSRGISQTATMSGAMSFAFKICNSLSLCLIGSILDIIKFDSNAPVQPLFVQNSLGNVLFLGILMSVSLAISLFSNAVKQKNKPSF